MADGIADLIADHQALRETVGAVFLPRDFVQVAGPDAIAWLQGQLSQDVAGLAEGRSAFSLLLQPQGKVDALLRVTRTGADAVILDTETGYGSAVVERLLRFKLRVKADVEVLARKVVAIRGPQALQIVTPEPSPGTLVLDATWASWPGVDVVGDSAAIPAGVPECGEAAYELSRIEAGVPAMGAEITERTIPAELGRVVMASAVNFTKGCYTGQELVARIDSRGGHVPKRLRMVTSTTEFLPIGTELAVGEKLVGVVTSVARRPEGGSVALAFMGRDVAPNSEVNADGDAARRAVVTAVPGDEEGG